MDILVGPRLPIAPRPGEEPVVISEDGPPGRHNVSTSLNYYKDPGDGSPPMPVIVGKSRVTNERPMVAFEVIVVDITGEEEKYTLDSHGFQLCNHVSSEKVFDDDERIKTAYFAESEQLLREVTRAARVLVFDHKVRRGPSYWHKLGKYNVASRGPLQRVHIDQSYDGAEIVLRRHLAKEADELMMRRWQIINVWRPIKTICQDPLAVADANSVPDEDLVAASVIHPGHRAETWTVRPGGGHRWYFKYKQTPDEVMLIKCFDSSEEVARRAPHCAFHDPAHFKDEDWRESIEVRALVFY